jgi:hypothetical protein
MEEKKIEEEEKEEKKTEEEKKEEKKTEEEKKEEKKTEEEKKKEKKTEEEKKEEKKIDEVQVEKWVKEIATIDQLKKLQIDISKIIKNNSMAKWNEYAANADKNLIFVTKHEGDSFHSSTRRGHEKKHTDDEHNIIKSSNLLNTSTKYSLYIAYFPMDGFNNTKYQGKNVVYVGEVRTFELSNIKIRWGRTGRNHLAEARRLIKGDVIEGKASTKVDLPLSLFNFKDHKAYIYLTSGRTEKELRNSVKAICNDNEGTVLFLNP